MTTTNELTRDEKVDIIFTEVKDKLNAIRETLEQYPWLTVLTGTIERDSAKGDPMISILITDKRGSEIEEVNKIGTFRANYRLVDPNKVEASY